MRLDEGIRRHGFKRWYSRELTRAHLRLLLLLLALLGLFASLELLGRGAPLSQQLGNFSLLLICLGVGLWSLRGYMSLMMRAEAIARCAICPSCQAYGRLELRDHEAGSDDVAVSCRKCSSGWKITDVGAD
jgi:hypothetical protein